MMHTFTRSLRSLPAWLMREYLEELGGVSGPDGRVCGIGWQASITQMEDFSVGSLRVGQIHLEWEGDDQALAATWPEIEKKLLRAGG